VFRLFLPSMPRAELDYRLYVWSFGAGTHDHVVDLWEAEQLGGLAGMVTGNTLFSVREPLPIATEDGWIVHLPRSWFGHEESVFFTADVRWKGKLLNHADVGWLVPRRLWP